VDRLKKEQVEIEYCPTGIMLGDFFTKPLQGSLFKKMRDVVMGLQPITILKTEEELNAKTSSEEDIHAELLEYLKGCINSDKRVLTPLLNRNKERVTKDNINVTFCNDCVFNQKTEKTNQLYDRPTYAQVATRSFANKQRTLR